MKSPLAIFSSLALCAGLALAQPGNEPVAGEGGNAANDSRPQSADNTQAAGDEQTVGPTDAGEEPVAEAPESGDNSPFDYQASEQISEDLSVSFPIDI